MCLKEQAVMANVLLSEYCKIVLHAIYRYFCLAQAGMRLCQINRNALLFNGQGCASVQWANTRESVGRRFCYTTCLQSIVYLDQKQTCSLFAGSTCRYHVQFARSVLKFSPHVQSACSVRTFSLHVQSACPVSVVLCQKPHSNGIAFFVRILTPPCGIASAPRCFLVMVDRVDIQCIVDMPTFYLRRFPAKSGWLSAICNLAFLVKCYEVRGYAELGGTECDCLFLKSFPIYSVGVKSRGFYLNLAHEY